MMHVTIKALSQVSGTTQWHVWSPGGLYPQGMPCEIVPRWRGKAHYDSSSQSITQEFHRMFNVCFLGRGAEVGEVLWINLGFLKMNQVTMLQGFSVPLTS